MLSNVYFAVFVEAREVSSIPLERHVGCAVARAVAHEVEVDMGLKD